MDLDLNGKLIMFNDNSRLFGMVRSLLEENGIRTAYSGKKQKDIIAAVKTADPDIFVYVCGLDDVTNTADISAVSGYSKNIRIIAFSYSSFPGRLASYQNAGAFRTAIIPMEYERIALLLKCCLITDSDSQIPYIADFLYTNGFSPRPKGFIPLCRIIEFCCRHPNCLIHPHNTRLIYRIACEFGYKAVNLDRLIRYIAEKEYSKRTVSKLTGREVWWRPGIIPFIAILCDKYTTHRRGVPHKLPNNAEVIQPEPIIQEIKVKKHQRRWVYVGKSKADRTDT